MESSKPIQLRIMTPEKVIYDELVNHVVIPGVDGEIGIYHHHAPFMSYIKTGHIHIYLLDQRVIKVPIQSGLFEFRDGSIIILTKEELSIEKLFAEEGGPE